MINKPIIDSINEVLESPNPYRFIVNIIRFSNDIKLFVKNSLEKAGQVGRLQEDQIENKIINQLAKNNYHHTWISFLQDYIIESRYWKDEVYLDSLCYIQNVTKTPDLIQRYKNNTLDHKIKPKKLHTINFDHTRTLIKHIQNSLLEEIEFNSLDSNIKKQIDILIENYPQNKKQIDNKLNKIVQKLGKNQKKYINYFKTKIIQNHFPETLKSIYRKISSLNLDKKEYNKLKTHIETNGTYQKVYEFKKLIIQLQDSIVSYLLKPVLLQKLANTLDSNPHDAKRKKIRYFMLFYSSDNYEEYQSLFKFLDDLESFLSNNQSKQFKIWFMWIISLVVVIIGVSIYFPLSILIPVVFFVFSIIYKVIKSIYTSTSYQINFDFKINLIISIGIGLSMLGVFKNNSPVNQKNIYELIQTDKYLANILQNPTPNNTQQPKNTLIPQNENKDGGNEKENTQTKIKQPVKNKIQNKNFFTNETVELGSGVYLRNLIDQILTTYTIEYNLTLTKIQKEILIKNIGEHYTTINISNFRQQNLNSFSGKMHRNELNKWIPSGFQIDMGQLEKVVIYNLNQIN